MALRKKKIGWLGFFISLLISIGLIVSYLAHPRFLEVIELKLFDLRFRWGKQNTAGSEVIIAAIDQKSIDELGRWPWPRYKIKSLIESLSKAGARIVAFDVTFPSPEGSFFSEYMKEYSQEMGDSEQIRRILSKFNPDQDFSLAIKEAGNVILGMFFILSSREAKSRSQGASLEPSFLTSQQYQLIQYLNPDAPIKASSRIARAYGFETSLNILGESALANGFFNMYPDFDGVIRWAPLIIEYNGHFYPSLDMQIIKHYWDLTDQSVLIQMNDYGVDGIYVEGVPVPTDERGNLLINYRGPDRTYPHYSISDIMGGKIPAENLQDKIVLVGATATGIYDMRYTPYKIMGGVEIHANILDSFLNLDFLSLPKEHTIIELLILLGLGILLGLLLPHTRALVGAISTVSLLLGYIGLNQYLFLTRGLWINLIYPVMEIMAIFTTITLYRYATEEREKRKIKNSFEHYLAPALVQELLHNPDMLQLGGEKKILTVLFSDIRGFTSISEQLKPEELITFLNQYMSAMSTIILNNSGLLDKFIGDAIMAVYCAPISREDHAVLACQSALEMSEALKEINGLCQEQNLPRIKIGVGINSGEMVIGNMGSKQRLEYTVLGDNVNLASRLEGITKVYGVTAILSEFTYPYVKDKFILRELDMVRVKGKNKPVKIYELAGKIKDKVSLQPIMLAYQEGLAGYRNRLWDEAIERFNQVLKLAPLDGPAKYYLERCQQARENPPPPEWDGVSTFTSK